MEPAPGLPPTLLESNLAKASSPNAAKLGCPLGRGQRELGGVTLGIRWRSAPSAGQPRGTTADGSNQDESDNPRPRQRPVSGTSLTDRLPANAHDPANR